LKKLKYFTAKHVLIGIRFRGILFAIAEVVHRPRSNFLLHFDIGNMQQIRTEKKLPGILFAIVEVVHRPRSDFLLHFDIGNIQQIRTEKKLQALGVCFPQPCSSACCMFAA